VCTQLSKDKIQAEKKILKNIGWNLKDGKPIKKETN